MQNYFLSFFLLLFVFGCSSEKQKELTVYSSLEEELLPPFIALWQETHPDIKLHIIRDSSGVIAARYAAELDNPQADVLWTTTLTGMANYVDTFVPMEFDTSNYKDKFFDAEEAGKPRWVGLTAWMGGFIVNTAELERLNLAMPLTYADLIKPEYKGLIVMPNPASSGTGLFNVSAWIQLWGEEAAWSYMDALNENISQYPHSGSAPTRLVVQGEAAIGLGIVADGLRTKQKGAPVEVVFPQAGSPWDVEFIAIPKKDEIKPEAYTFYQWATSEEVGKLYAEYRGILGDDRLTPALEGYPDDVAEQLLDYDFAWTVANKDAFLKEWGNRYGTSN